ncbi:proline-rich transmembrane protein 1-like isoform X2 [Asterias rubens]|uniref:proline-rich transmembrane protein 1-like isoform X2 n=1 Tax=Asterias rubens TaxID=7604 RepID=UPI00145594C4|nr:proline-rich transmembrane protein 1-like isoform X2 [Asterias rubens]
MTSAPPGYDKSGYDQQPQQTGYPPQAMYNPQQGGQVAVAPGPTVIVRQQGATPNDHLIASVLVTLFCCCPFGIIAILKSMDVRTRIASGDLAGAQEVSRQAKTWCTVALVTGIALEVIGIVAFIFYYVFVISVAASAFNNYNNHYG